ncbi:MAG TPA: flagellar basal body protein [Candidatus Flavonifractor merdavium]|nr:flagellar basal body protein [Candidatus Flavonifractor merdavium]
MGTFGSFGTVRLGIYAAQKGLDVTGNNITNINTEGYTRQRLNQVSLIPGASDRYFSSYKTRIGQGAVVAGVDQLRDPGLDISYRKAVADVGSANAKLGGLNDLATILDEVGKGDLDQDDGVILSQLNDLRDLINEAITNGVGTYNSLIRESSKSLASLFNTYADKLEKLDKTYQDKLDQEVTEVNNILKNIQELNVAIRNADIRGDEGLELRDQRNLLLDKLNEYVKVDVKYSMENIGADTYVERLTITLANDPPHNHTLVDGEYAAKMGVDKANNYGINLYALRDSSGAKKDPNDTDPVPLLDNDLYGSLQSLRELLTEKGEYSTTPESLDKALQSNVDEVNSILNQIASLNGTIYGGGDQAAIVEATAKRDQLLTELKGYVDVTTSDTPAFTIQLAGGNKETLLSNQTVTELQKVKDPATGEYSVTVGNAGASVDAGDLNGTLGSALAAANSPADTTLDPDASSKRGIPYYRMTLDNLARTFAERMNELNNTGLAGSGALFSNSSSGNDTSNITAANISVSFDWSNDKVSIQATDDPNAPSGDTSRLAEFLNLFNREDIDFVPGNINPGAAGDAYTGSFENMLLRIQSTLAEDQMTTDAVLNNHLVTANDIYVDRDSVMGVDLNDEATSLMTYQKAYAAACRLMTTLNTALDSLLAM